MKTKYRLQPVLDLRERAKKAAVQFVDLRRQQLATAKDELSRCQETVTANLRKQKEASETMFAQMQSGTEARNVLAHHTHLAELREHETLLREALKNQEKIVKQAEAELERAIDNLAEAVKEVKVIETHRKVWHTTRKIESERREQKFNDEIGAILFQTSTQRENKRQK
jgi:flagellar export protein FliJ